MANCHSIQQTTAITGAFTDPRIILVRPDDSRLASRPMSECHIEQSFDTPTFVAIGKSADDGKLAKVSTRYSVPLEDLQAFRDGMRWIPIIRFDDGQVKRFPSCLTHSEAAAVSEREAALLSGVDYFAAQREVISH
jgi:hypothetical protein